MLAAIYIVLSCFATLSVTQHAYWNVEENGSCVDPNGQSGQCIIIHQCPTLLSLLKQRPLQSETVKFLRDAQCGFDGRNPKVCCSQSERPSKPKPKPKPDDDSESNRYTDMRPQEQREPSQYKSHPNFRLLPNDCGFDSTERIWGGGVTAIGELPFLALFQYLSASGMKKFLCSGAIINKRYILTAAHCLSRSELRGHTLSMVRLGEWDITKNPDCERDLATSEENCALPPQDLGVEKIVMHNQYSARSSNKWNDIGLVRVNKDIKYTDYVQPVCLPLTDMPRSRLQDNTLVVAGWGRTESVRASNVKMKIELPMVSNQECQRVYEEKGRVIGEGQICAGGEKDRDSCTGDSGSPLMNEANSRFYAVGIVSYGPEMCGKANWPGVYTRVSNYINWILDNLSP